jgi:hypothetical protein
MCSRAALHGLEVDGKVENEREEPGAEHKGEREGEGHVTVLEEARRQCSLIAEFYLREYENASKKTKAHEEADDPGALPWVCGATPLEGEEQADNSRNQNRGADQVELENSLCDGEAFRIVFSRDMQEENDDQDREGTDWEAVV